MNSIVDGVSLLFLWLLLLAFLILLSFSPVFAGPLDGFEIVPVFMGIGGCATAAYVLRLTIRWLNRRDDPVDAKRPFDAA